MQRRETDSADDISQSEEVPANFDEPIDEFDGDALLEEEIGTDALEDEFGSMLVQLAGGICSELPTEEKRNTCLANFESLPDSLPTFANDLNITLDDIRTTLLTCAPCLMEEGKKETCPLQPLLQTYKNETTCEDFIARLFPDLN